MTLPLLKAPSAVLFLSATLIASHVHAAQPATAPPQASETAATAATGASAAQGASASDPATLVVTFRGLKSTQGALMISLSNAPASFAGSKPAVAEQKLSIIGDEVIATFAGLIPGRYAVRVFHDLDGDGKLKTNAFGVPLEPFAFSNNARGLAGPPSWSAASFEVVPGVNTQSIAID